MCVDFFVGKGGLVAAAAAPASASAIGSNRNSGILDKSGGNLESDDAVTLEVAVEDPRFFLVFPYKFSRRRCPP